jgi:hypothetical protein
MLEQHFVIARPNKIDPIRTITNGRRPHRSRVRDVANWQNRSAWPFTRRQDLSTRDDLVESTCCREGS